MKESIDSQEERSSGYVTYSHFKEAFSFRTVPTTLNPRDFKWEASADPIPLVMPIIRVQLDFVIRKGQQSQD